MTPEDPESRRIAEELARRERRRPETDAPPVDPATLAALFEKHEGEVTRIVGQAEEALTERIDKLANAQGAAAERLRREIPGLVKGDRTEVITELERRLKEEQRAALEKQSTELKQGLEALKKSIDKREGGVFAGIDGVAENVKPAADALKGLHHAVAGTTAAARDVAAIREAVVDNRRATDEVVTIRETVARSEKAIDAVVEMRPVLDRIETSFGTWIKGMRRRRWLGWIRFVVLAILLGTGGVALQRETGIWPSEAEIENRDRDAFWERHGEQITACRDTARKYGQAMACTIVVMDP
ncbi:MAG: hypothetical protein OXB94_14165 [Nitrospira sp.]|nr:hypothetical protein [Nitrospira sp.]